MQLKSKVIKGGFYLSLANIGTQIVSIVVTIILARLLLPKDFGLIALATTYIGLIDMLANISFGSAIIYYHKSTQRQLSTLYWINCIWALFIFMLIYSTVPIAASFYNEVALIDIVRISALTILISPLFTIHYKIKERDIEFVLLSKLTIAATFTGSVSAVIAAYLGMGVYALVIKIIVSTFTKLVLVLLFVRWKPSLTFRLQEVKNMIWYSLKLKISQTFFYIERNVDYLVLGKFFSSSILGYYAFSYNIMYSPVKRISYIFSDILFPAFSYLKNDRQKIIRGLLKSLQIIALVSFPAMTLIAINADWIVKIIFGHKWDEAVPIIEVLAFAGAIQSVSQPAGVVFKSIGKPEIGIYLAPIRALLVVVAIVLGALLGNILTVAYLILVAKIISLIMVLSIIRYFIPYRLLDLIRSFKGSLINIAVLGLMQYISVSQLSVPGWLKFSSTIIVALSLTIIFHYNIILELIKNVRAKI